MDCCDAPVSCSCNWYTAAERPTDLLLVPIVKQLLKGTASGPIIQSPCLLDDLTIMTTKLCSNCKKTLPIDDFHRIGPAQTKFGNWCEPCYQKIKARRAPAKPTTAPSGKS